MRRSVSRFVTACQQLLAVGAVVAVLAPMANVVSLDVITRPAPAGDGTTVADRPRLEQRVDLPAADRTQAPAPEQEAEVETEPVEPVVREYEMTAATTAAAEEQTPGATEEQTGGDDHAHGDEDVHDDEDAQDDATAPRKRSTAPGASVDERTILSQPEPVTGYGAVGVTWSSQTPLADDEIEVLVRTRTDGTWSTWHEVEYHDEHGPDPATAEGKQARPGTDALLVGEVDEVQAKAVTAAGVEVPGDLKLAVIAPGRSHGTEVEEPAIDTAKLHQDEDADAGEEQDPGTTLETDEGAIELQAGSFTPKPQIYSRKQWGANERLRDKGSLRYYEVHAGFVHHTVNANDYSRSQVPGIIRSIYAYHTQTRGWSDVGYNFLVDKFGRIWEGRAGGVDRPVVGAHTLGYNDYSFAMSAIGNFETAKPTSAMLRAYGRLFAWKLSLHGVDATSTSQQVGPRRFPAINGHRDAGSTACPGRHLYAKIPSIRRRAARLQADWSGRELATDLVGSPQPDLVLRRGSDKRGFLLPTDGLLDFDQPKVIGTGWGGFDAVVPTPDVTGDGRPDILTRRPDGRAGINPGRADGRYGGQIKVSRKFRRFDQITAVGDLTGDDKSDFVARRIATGRLHLFRGRGNGTFVRSVLAQSWPYDMTIATGDVTGDGKADVLSRDKAGKLWVHPGQANRKLGTPFQSTRAWARYNVITGFGDYSGDGEPDLFVRASATGRSYVFPGRGDGTFSRRIGPFGAAKGLSRLNGATNIAGTPDPDLFAVRGDRLVAVPHAGTHNFGDPVPVGDAFAHADAVYNVGDWDRDGHGDVLTRHSRTGVMYLHRGTGKGLAAPIRFGTRNWHRMNLIAAVGDTTGDGYPDLMAQPRGKAMRIYPGRGVKGFRKSYVARSPISASEQVGLGRWNGDGAPDNLFRVGNKLVWYRGNGPGGLTGSAGSIGFSLRGYDWVISAGDVDGDGRQDLIGRRRNGHLWLIPGTSNGFGKRKFLGGGFKTYDLGG